MRMYRGVELLHTFLTSALYESEWSALTLGKEAWYPLDSLDYHSPYSN
jgi:hypothetical protein